MHAIAALLFAATLLPQGGGKTIAGRVLDVDGKPVAGAEVVLLHRDLPCVADAGPVHEVRIASDERGMFRGNLQEHCSYSASARWRGAASVIEEGVEAPGFVELRQDPLAVPRQVQLRGLDAFADRAPFRLQVSFGSENLELLAVAVHDGAAELPALPFRQGMVAEVLDRQGEVLWTCDLEGGECTVPPPRELQLAVRDEKGAPIAGAEIRRHLRNYWYTQSAAVLFMDRFRCLWPKLGVTDQNGQLRVRVPVPGDADVPLQDLLLMARKDGMQGSLCGFQQGGRFREGKVDDDGAEAAAGAEIVFTLSPSDATARTLQPGTALPPADAPMALRWRVNIRRKNGGSGFPFVEATPPPAAGGLLLPAMPERSETEGAWAVLSDAMRGQLAQRFGFWPPRTFRPLQPQNLLATGTAQLDLDALQALAVVAADGRPAERAVVLITPHQQGRDQQAIAARTDRLGRVLVPLGSRISVLTATGHGSLQLADTANAAATHLELQPLRTRTVRVTGKDGKPVAGIAVRAAAFEARAPTADDGELPPTDLQTLLTVLPTLRTDADGCARLRFPPSPGLLRLQACIGSPPLPATSVQVAIGIGEARDDISIEIDATGGK